MTAPTPPPPADPLGITLATSITVRHPGCGWPLFYLHRYLQPWEGFWSAYARLADGSFVPADRPLKCAGCGHDVTQPVVRRLLYADAHADAPQPAGRVFDPREGC